MRYVDVVQVRNEFVALMEAMRTYVLFIKETYLLYCYHSILFTIERLKSDDDDDDDDDDDEMR
ncbi:MAG: chromatin segregation and condensation protein Rec8/ScpA/Scc1 (kleisin family) [Bacillariaceae sp.]|jgi:chromatin segregation and condensation protein Rec8/ScpA/Scc1 (kleisin family)